MTDRLLNQWHVPTAAICGFALQKAIAIFFLLVKHKDKSQFMFYRLCFLSWIVVVPLLFCVVGIVYVDEFINSANNPTAVNLSVVYTFGNVIVSLLVLFLLFKRLGIFQEKKTFGYRAMAALIIVAVICRVFHFLLSLVCYAPYLAGKSSTTYASCPVVSLVGLGVLLANGTDAIVFILATFTFLHHIASKLSITSLQLLKSLIMDHDGGDYLMLIGVKVYILYVGFTLIAVGKLDNRTNPVIAATLLGTVLEIYTFMTASYETSNDMVKSHRASRGRPSLATDMDDAVSVGPDSGKQSQAPSRRGSKVQT